MKDLLRRQNIDILIEQFWRNGYLTLSRKFGTFLPEPSSVGGFEVDAIARQKNRYAIGIIINNDDLTDYNSFLEKVKHLATRHTKYQSTPVKLFLGIRDDCFKEMKQIINRLDEDIKKNIKLFQITKQDNSIKKRTDDIQTPLFS
jgi:hypothetical protein